MLIYIASLAAIVVAMLLIEHLRARASVARNGRNSNTRSIKHEAFDFSSVGNADLVRYLVAAQLDDNTVSFGSLVMPRSEPTDDLGDMFSDDVVANEVEWLRPDAMPCDTMMDGVSLWNDEIHRMQDQ